MSGGVYRIKEHIAGIEENICKCPTTSKEVEKVGTVGYLLNQSSNKPNITTIGGEAKTRVRRQREAQLKCREVLMMTKNKKKRIRGLKKLILERG
nr:uncharacterized protein LOC109173953 [Ipomoea batatas]